MKILFLDDMDARHVLAREIASNLGIDVDSVYTAEEAIRKLEHGSYEAACLDHDLADDHYAGPYVSPSMGGTAHSGRAVARWISEHGKPENVLVHSFNPDGAKAICEHLSDSQHLLKISRAPFGPVSFGRWLLTLGSAA